MLIALLASLAKTCENLSGIALLRMQNMTPQESAAYEATFFAIFTHFKEDYDKLRTHIDDLKN